MLACEDGPRSIRNRSSAWCSAVAFAAHVRASAMRGSSVQSRTPLVLHARAGSIRPASFDLRQEPSWALPRGGRLPDAVRDDGSSLYCRRTGRSRRSFIAADASWQRKMKATEFPDGMVGSSRARPIRGMACGSGCGTVTSDWAASRCARRPVENRTRLCLVGTDRRWTIRRCPEPLDRHAARCDRRCDGDTRPPCVRSGCRPRHHGAVRGQVRLPAQAPRRGYRSCPSFGCKGPCPIFPCSNAPGKLAACARMVLSVLIARLIVISALRTGHWLSTITRRILEFAVIGPIPRIAIHVRYAVNAPAQSVAPLLA